MTETRMQEEAKYAPGTFCWVELTTTEAEGAKKFYTELFKWDFEDMPIGPGMVYTMFKQEGKDVGAVYQMTDEMKKQGIPSNWLSYASIANADETAAKARETGATILQEPMDVFDFGRMAVIKDPTGAVFALWQAGLHAGAGLVNVPNSLCWNELVTPDMEKASAFYKNLFGWGEQAHQSSPMPYTMFTNNGKPIAGMYAPTPEMGEVPPHWMIYFAVSDADELTTKATGLGASVIVPPCDIPEVGRFAIIRDPQGAAFAIITLKGQ